MCASIVASREFTARSSAGRLATFASRSFMATAALVSHEKVQAELRRMVRGATDLHISRAEWTVAGTTGVSAFITGGMIVRNFGARPTLAMPFLMIPTFYVTLAVREELVLLRSTRPLLYESGLCAAIAAVPPILFLPPLLRPLGIPLIGIPILAGWLAEDELEIELPGKRSPAGCPTTHFRQELFFSALHPLESAFQTEA